MIFSNNFINDIRNIQLVFNNLVKEEKKSKKSECKTCFISLFGDTFFHFIYIPLLIIIVEAFIVTLTYAFCLIQKIFNFLNTDTIKLEKDKENSTFYVEKPEVQQQIGQDTMQELKRINQGEIEKCKQIVQNELKKFEKLTQNQVMQCQNALNQVIAEELKGAQNEVVKWAKHPGLRRRILEMQQKNY